MAGIDTYEDGPGYKHIKIKPHIGGNFTNVSASLITYYGKISSAWKVEDNTLEMDVEIPDNTTATVYIPANNEGSVTENGTPVNSVKDIKVMTTEGGYVVVQVGSGKYNFIVKQL